MVLSFDKFRSYVWNHEPVDNATIRAEISRLRRVLKEDFIENIKGVGYKIERFIKT
jgi:DNA-binding winged helix-turn-helix (wHTH) protein